MKLKIVKTHKDAKTPFYQTEGAAGFDLCALHKVTVFSNKAVAIPTGLKVEVPKGYELQIRPRSGLSLNSGLRVANSPGTIDSDYRGEIYIIMDNISEGIYNEIVIEKGQRIAQAVLKKVERAEIEIVDELSETKRGEKGLGSTGKK